jgi:hypothetical protein
MSSKRVTAEVKNQMIELSKNNKKLKEISQITGFSEITCAIYTKPKRMETYRKYRQNRFTDPVIKSQRREYMRNYMRNRYKTDAEFRKKMNQTAILYTKRRRATDPTFRETQKEYSKKYYAKSKRGNK